MPRSSVIDEVENRGIYNNLMSQIDKYYDQTNRGSKETRVRYWESESRFCGFLADEFRIQKIDNIKEKHIVAYVEKMCQDGYAGKTMRTDLSGIRFFHDIGNGKNNLPNNRQIEKAIGFQLPETNVGVVDRAWTKNESSEAKIIALELGRKDVIVSVDLIEKFGLRINELGCISVGDLKKALATGEMLVHDGTKNGQPRTVPIRNDEQREILKSSINYAKSEGRTADWQKVVSDSAKYGVQKEKESLSNWVRNHRDEFKEDFRDKNSPEFEAQKAYAEAHGMKTQTQNLTWHGLRYSFAQNLYSERYDHYQNQGYSNEVSEYCARKDTSEQLGHHRDSVTLIYLK